MDMDFGTLCLLGIFIIVGLMLFSRMFGGRSGGAGGTDFGQRGTERPTYDDPDVESRGAFGANPRGSSGRSFRRSFGNRSGGGGLFGGRSGGSSGGRADSGDVKSRGSFGRPKK